MSSTNILSGAWRGISAMSWLSSSQRDRSFVQLNCDNKLTPNSPAQLCSNLLKAGISDNCWLHYRNLRYSIALVNSLSRGAINFNVNSNCRRNRCYLRYIGLHVFKLNTGVCSRLKVNILLNQFPINSGFKVVTNKTVSANHFKSYLMREVGERKQRTCTRTGLNVTCGQRSYFFIFFIFFVIKRIGMRYRHMEKYGLGHWALGLFFGPFFWPFYRGGRAHH